MKIPIIVDTDPGLGHLFSDVDDALAIFTILNSDDIFEVIGFTVSYGNVKVDIAYKLLKKYLKVAKKDSIPIIKGVKNRYQLGKENPASQFIIDTINEYPNEITIFALAPLTNLATAFIKDKELKFKIKELRIMGGVINTTVLKFSPITKFLDEKFFNIPINNLVAEFNIINDPLAAKIVFNQQLKTKIFPLNVTCKTKIRKFHLLKLRERNSPITNFCYRNILSWYFLNTIVTGDGFYPHDVLVPMSKIDETIFKFKKLCLDIDIKNVPGKIQIISNNNKIKRTNFIEVCYDLDKDKFLNKLLMILMK